MLLNGRLSFLSGSANFQRPQSHSKSQFPAGTWRWAHSGGLHQAAGIRSGGRSPAETEASLGPSQPGQGVQVQGWREAPGWGRGCRRPARHRPNPQLFVVALPKLPPCALGAGLGDAGKAHPHLSMGRDEVMGARLMPPPPQDTSTLWSQCSYPPTPPRPPGDRSLLYRQKHRAIKWDKPPRGFPGWLRGRIPPPGLTGWPQHRHFPFISHPPSRQEKGKALCFLQTLFQQPGDPLQGLRFSNTKTLHIINLRLL